MFAYIKGTLISKSIDHLIIETNQIGFNINISSKFFDLLTYLNSELTV